MKACVWVIVSLFSGIAAVARDCAAQHTHTKFTPTSAVYKIDDTTSGVGAEVLLAPPDPGTTVTDADLHFKLPEGGTITKLQATISFAFPWGPTQNICPQPGEALGMFIIDGKRFAPIIQKLNSSSAAGAREITTFVSYDIPLHYTKGEGILHVEANPFGCWSNWEIQGMVSITRAHE
jgi:hypothetical protein